MNVHIGQITSEIRAASSTPADDGGGESEMSVWDDRVRLAATLERVTRDRLRTATGCVDD